MQNFYTFIFVFLFIHKWLANQVNQSMNKINLALKLSIPFFSKTQKFSVIEWRFGNKCEDKHFKDGFHQKKHHFGAAKTEFLNRKTRVVYKITRSGRKNLWGNQV